MPLGQVEVNCAFNGGYCGKCCLETRMPLTEEDISRIKSLGYPEWYFVQWENVPRLRNEKGKCVFLREDGSCSIYEHRPKGCRLYPLIFDSERGPTVDSRCPRRKGVEYDESDVEALLELVKEVYGEGVQQ